MNLDLLGMSPDALIAAVGAEEAVRALQAEVARAQATERARVAELRDMARMVDAVDAACGQDMATGRLLRDLADEWNARAVCP